MIRPGRPSDLEGIRALAEEFASELEAAGRPAVRPDDRWDPWISRRLAAGDVRVVVEDDRPVGFIVWETRPSPAGRVLAVTHLYVRRTERRNRHGGGLLARALDRARAESFAVIEIAEGLGDAAALALLGSYGFAPSEGGLALQLGA